MVAQVVMYVGDYCGYCHAAKRLLRAKGVDFEEVNVDQKADLRQWLVKATGQRTIPQVFINGQAIGGFSELAGLDREGRLSTLLAEDAPPAPG